MAGPAFTKGPFTTQQHGRLPISLLSNNFDDPTCHDKAVDDPIKAFTAQARRYCSFIEGDSISNSWMFAQACLTQLLILYQAALLLPEIASESADLLESINHGTWQAVRERVVRRLARDYHWEVFEPLDQERPGPVLGSLSDDLADIWRDLKPGVVAIDSGGATSTSDVVWEWRTSFETHWGQHAVGAICALHALCFGPFSDGNRPTLRP